MLSCSLGSLDHPRFCQEADREADRAEVDGTGSVRAITLFLFIIFK